MINLNNYSIFKNCQTSLKKTSKDTEHNVYLVDDERIVVDFDEVKTQYLKKIKLRNQYASSVDALFEKASKLVFLEC